MGAAVDVLRKPCKCGLCGELMPAGTAVTWEQARGYRGANGGISGSGAKARWIPSHDKPSLNCVLWDVEAQSYRRGLDGEVVNHIGGAA